MLRIIDLKLSLDKAINHDSELFHLKKLIVRTFNISETSILSIKLYKKAIDARKKEQIHFVYSVDIEVKNEGMIFAKGHRQISVTPHIKSLDIPVGTQKLKYRPVIIGFGPSGIFSALLLAKKGYRPIVLERGLDVDQRHEQMDHFLKTLHFSENASILFGEGGAGTYSDGKLTTLISDIRCRFVLEELVSHGAPEEIMYINKPHVGTDLLRGVIKNIRQDIIKMGGEVRFNACVTDLVIHNNHLTKVIINHKEELLTNHCLLGIGHSARDTFKMLYDNQIPLSQKPFAIGVRIEHPQALINQSQYGVYANHPSLGAADYKLSYHSQNNRSAYTFCMCPGGYVVCATSEALGVVTNGMSESKRDSKNANSALLVNINPEDFKSNHPLAGIDYQRHYEQLAFKLAGSNYNAPIQKVGDFLNDRLSTSLGVVIPSYKPGYTFVKMTDIYPKFITNTMKEAILDFNQKIKGFALDDAIMTGVETRSSSPVRITRDDNHQSSIRGLYPMGEGAGYAGGIMSASVDGMKTAEQIITNFAPFDL
ncbi:MAG: hypothetical protein CVV56_06230 [Tenericutes bacterium HGW-Tenericutes-1]|jgi:hypothetical protein|nr:MAG: hypothetical protein CVV56_06230 [Tenericutes bacterium HGW-Tenericutes-1]